MRYDAMFNNMTRWMYFDYLNELDLNDQSLRARWRPLKSNIDLQLSTWHSGSTFLIPFQPGLTV